MCLTSLCEFVEVGLHKFMRFLFMHSSALCIGAWHKKNLCSTKFVRPVLDSHNSHKSNTEICHLQKRGVLYIVDSVKMVKNANSCTFVVIRMLPGKTTNTHQDSTSV